MSSLPELPPTKGEKADANKLAAYFDHIFRHDTPYRVGIRRVMNRARLYYMSRQWLDKYDDPLNPNWQVMRSELAGIPMPVQNELFPIVTRESALLVGVGTRPYVRPDDDDPRTEDAAKIAKDVLLSRSEEEQWLEQQQEGSFHLALYGTWFQASWWDIDFSKTTRIPVTTAVHCPDCDFVLAKPEVDEDQALEIAATRPAAVDMEDIDAVETPSANPLIEPLRKYTVRQCPVCDTHEEDGLVPAEGSAVDDESAPPALGISDEASIDADLAPAEPSALPPAPLGPALVPGPVRAPGGPDLVPYPVTETEGKGGEDFLGRPLGEDIAEGNTASAVVNPFDAWPEPTSQGVDSSSANWEEFGWETPRSIPWIRNHYANGIYVERQDSDIIYENHPIVSNVDGTITYAAGPECFEDHALWRVIVQKPRKTKGEDGEWAMNRGRLVVMANRTVLLDADLMMESQNKPGTFVQRMHFDWVQWEKRDREAWGLGMIEIAASQQDSINTEKSQIMMTRHHHGNPKWLIPDGITMSNQGGANSGYTADFLFFQKSSPDVSDPLPFGNTLMNPGIWQEHDRDVEAAARILMTREIEGGEPPKSVDAYSALLLLAQKAAEGRKPRLERIRAMKKRLYKHKLSLIHEMYREKRYYYVRGKNDKWAVKSFRGADLMGQTNVLLEDEPLVDVGIAKRQGIEQGLKVGSIVIQTQADKRIVNRILEIDPAINEGNNQQVDKAEDEFIQWLDADIAPVIDEGADAHEIHWDSHRIDLERDDWRELKERCDWNSVKLAYWGWQKELQTIEEAEKLNLLQPPVPPVETMAQTNPPAYDAAMQQYQMRMQGAQEIAKLPKPLELRILHIWNGMLTKAGYEAPMAVEDPDEGEGLPPLTPEQALKKVLRAEAHTVAHRWLAQAESMAAQAGVPQPAVPGGMENAQGNIPSPGEPVADAGGAAEAA